MVTVPKSGVYLEPISNRNMSKVIVRPLVGELVEFVMGLEKILGAASAAIAMVAEKYNQVNHEKARPSLAFFSILC